MKRGSKSVLDLYLIPWKYRGSTCPQKFAHAGERKGFTKFASFLVLTGKSLKVYEGAREDASPRGGAGRSVSERSGKGTKTFPTLGCGPKVGGTLRRNNLDVYA